MSQSGRLLPVAGRPAARRRLLTEAMCENPRSVVWRGAPRRFWRTYV